LARFPFIPREQKFFDFFEVSAQNMVKAAHELRELVYNWENVKQKIDTIAELEHQGDAITHQIIAQLHRTFITPFDREDMCLLARKLDDVTDCIDAAAGAMQIYKVAHPNQKAKDLAKIILQATAEIEKAMPHLRNHSSLKELLPLCVEINRLENAADAVFNIALSELFDDTSDIPYVIKWHEIYNHMERATDKCEDVADVLEGIALKHA